MRKLLLVLMLLPMVASANKSGKCGDNVYYSYNSVTHTLTIYGEGAIWSNFIPETEVSPWSSLYTDDIDNIRSVIIESGVTSIGRWAFSRFRGLTSITIPNSVTSIGSEAFWGSGLTFLTIPNSVTNIQKDAFIDCPNLTSIIVEDGNMCYDSRNNCNAIIDTNNQLIAGCKNTIIPNSVTSIGEWAFSCHTGLTSLNIPNNVTSIGHSAFSGCSGLTSITIPNSLTSIGGYAFQNCKGLVSVISEIEDPFEIDNTVFDGIPSYAQLIVPQGTKAKYQATAGWNRFFNIVESSGKWGNNVFYDYNAITYKLTISGEGPMWDIEDYDEHPWRYSTIKNLEIEHGVTSIGKLAFTRFGITSVTIPSSVKSIGVYAFLFCGSLASVIIPNSVSTIFSGAFQGCGKLTRVVSEIENPFAINNTVFAGISSDATLIVPKGTIDKYKATAGWNFANIVEETGIEDGDFSENGIYYNIKSDGYLEVTGLASWTTIADIPSSITINGTKYRVTSIGERAFEGRNDITYLSIPYSIKSIGKYAFRNCGSSMTVNIADPESWCQMQLGNEHASPLSSAGKMLVHDIETASFTVPETVTSIGAFTFYQCSCLESLYVPGTVTSLGSSAFEDCDYLTSVTLSEGLQTIGGSAFEGCKRLNTLTIPSTVNSILINAFKNCSSLTSVVSEIQNPFVMDNSVFDGIPSNAQIIIPKGTKSEYQATAGWNHFTNIVEVGGIGYSFVIDNLKYTVLQNNSVSVVSYGGSVSNFVIPAYVKYNGETYTVTTIGGSAFANRINLESVTIPNTVTTIEGSAFVDCHDLFLIIPNSVTYIGSGAFRWSGIPSINIPNSVTYIGAYAFNHCSALTTVFSEIEDPFEIDNSVFDSSEMPSNAKLIVPKGTKTKYQATEGWNRFTNIVEDGSVLDGDVNGDGFVNDADAHDVASYIMGKTPTGFNKDAADINKDDKVNVADIVLINNIIKKNR